MRVNLKNVDDCPGCKRSATYHDIGFEPYYRTPSSHSEIAKLHIAEPVMVNPASEEAVRTVIQHVQEHTMTDGRVWGFLHSDGGPYVIASNLQDNAMICKHCQEKFDRRDFTEEEWLELEAEHKTQHAVTESPFAYEFSDVLLLPGPGHIEMNVGKKLLGLLWTPFLRDYIKALGFRSEAAQRVVKL